MSSVEGSGLGGAGHLACTKCKLGWGMLDIMYRVRERSMMYFLLVVRAKSSLDNS